MTDEPRGENAPTREDERHDDLEFNPAIEPSSAKAWINLLTESEKAFERWNDHCDNIDKRFANLERLSTMSREREFQIFWANLEVLKPSIYAKPPIPVVVPKFKDNRPVPLAASEVMERCCIVAFDLTRINELMLLVRDDVVLYSRGVSWCRYEKGNKDSSYKYEKVCIDHKNRRDFLHSLSRNWREVTWVAAASYMTRAAGARPVLRVFRLLLPRCRIQGRSRRRGNRRHRQARARQVLGDLAQGRAARRVGCGGVRGHSRRGRAAP